MRDEITQAVFYDYALHPKKLKKQTRIDVCNQFGIGWSYYYQVLKEVDPERLKSIKESAARFAEFYGSKEAT